MHGPPATEESHQIEALTRAGGRVAPPRGRARTMERRSRCKRCAAVSASSDSISGTRRRFARHSGCIGPVAARHRRCLPVARHHRSRNSSTTRGHNPGPFVCRRWLISSLRISIGSRLSVAMHGITAACIVAPLLWEATVRFHTVPAAASASVLALFVILGQAFAWQRDHSALAGVTALAGAATAMALIIATLNPVPFATALAVAAVVIELGAYRGRALSWRWIVALACDFCAFLLLYLITRPQGLPEGYPPIPTAAVGALLIALAATYVISTALRTLALGTAITGFEIAQIVVAAALAIGGGLRMSHGAGPLPVFRHGLPDSRRGLLSRCVHQSGSRAQFPRLCHVRAPAGPYWRRSLAIQRSNAMDHDGPSRDGTGSDAAAENCTYARRNLLACGCLGVWVADLFSPYAHRRLSPSIQQSERGVRSVCHRRCNCVWSNARQSKAPRPGLDRSSPACAHRGAALLDFRGPGLRSPIAHPR